MASCLGACATHVRAPADPILLPLRQPAAWLPEPSDRAAAKAAEAALASNQALLEERVTEIQRIDDGRKGPDLEVLSQDLANSTLDDPRAYRAASKKLKSGWGTDPAVQSRLDQAVSDDPLALAGQRRRDTWERYWARTFNAVAQSVGQSVLTGFIFAPVQVATTAGHYLASFSNDEALSTTHRQALVLHKEHLARHGDDQKTEHIKRQVAEAEEKLAKTMQTRRLRAARAALAAKKPGTAAIESKRVLAWGAHEEASEIHANAQEQLQTQGELAKRSLQASSKATFRAGEEWESTLAFELLLTSSRGEPLSDESIDRLHKQVQSGKRDRGEALYILAIAQKDSGFEDESWKTLEQLARQPIEESPMARHAAHLVRDPWQNPYGAYRTMLSHRRNKALTWRLFGTYAQGTHYPNLPRPVSFALEGPGMASTVVTSPLRILFGSFESGPDFQRPAAVLGYRYLGLNPSGQHSQEVMNWLFEYEVNRGNHAAALRLADFQPGLDPEKRNELAEAASAQSMTAAQRMRRPDQRTQILRQTSREYPDTGSGLLAGQQVRWEFEHSSPQKIRVTRDFLAENPAVAGPSGLGLNPELINGDLADGELHPSGVSMLGGRILRFNLMPRSGDENDPPQQVEKKVSEVRMARLASTLEETTYRNQLIDADDSLAADADRDRFLERARMGLTHEMDARPTAQSTYVYQSMRERYGLVRGRESILPFDLVVSGSVQNLNLGAFPRWRPPKETPDAFLYR